MSREDFSQPVPRKDILKEIEKAARGYAGKTVFLCFTCDPYQRCEVDHGITRSAIEILHRNNVGVRILSKGGYRSLRDFDLLTKTDSFGATLTFCDDKDGQEFEPGAAPWQERIVALKEAKKRGLYTWVSLEPVIRPEQTLEIVHKTASFVAEYKVGGWNYDSRAKNIDWKKFYLEVTGLMQRHRKRYFIKEDLRRLALDR